MPPEHPHPEDQKFACIVLHCDWETVRGELTNHQLNEVIAQHAESHQLPDYIDTIVHYQNLAAERRNRIDELESALRGAALMQGTDTPPGGIQVVREPKHGDTIEVAGKKGELVGKRLPDGLAKAMGLPTRKDHEKRRRRGN